MIHGWSDRAAGPFVSVNAGGLSESVFESEIFGHVRGAFTDAKSDRAGRLEMADGLVRVVFRDVRTDRWLLERRHI